MARCGMMRALCVVAAVGACDSSGTGAGKCAPGSERCECYPNDTCNEGLTCLSSRCVVDESAAGAGRVGTTTGASGGSTTSGGTSSAGGGAAPGSAGSSSSSGGTMTSTIVQGGTGGVVGSGLGGTANAIGGAPSGGSSALGGTNATGGANTSGGISALGGRMGSGGVVASGGTPTSGGSNASGGTPASGGFAGGGGSNAVGGTSTCTRGTAGSYFLFDDFECGASLWTPQPASALALVADGSNTYAVTTITNSLSYATIGSPMTANFRVEARVKAVSFQPPTVGWSYVGLFGDFDSANTFFAVTWWPSGTVAATRRLNGAGEDVSTPGNELTLGQWYTFRLEREGATTRAYCNDELISTSTGNKTPTGRIAIGAYNATARFDDVRVTLL